MHTLSSRNGRLAGDAGAIEKVFDELKQTEATLVLHFHGGLLSDREIKANSDRWNDAYRKTGAVPVFFEWETGFLDSLTHRLSEIWGESAFQFLRTRVLQLVVDRQLTATNRGALTDDTINEELQKNQPFAAFAIARDEKALRLTLFDEEEIKSAVEEDGPLVQSFVDILPALSSGFGSDNDLRPRVPTLLSSGLLRELIRSQQDLSGLGNAIGTHVARALSRVFLRFKNQRDHGLYGTVIEEILREFYLDHSGYQLWQHLIKNTADAFGDHHDCVGSAFVRRLYSLIASGRKQRIVLVGQSAGAAYVSQFLKHAGQALPPGVKFDIVLLAPACTIDSFFEVVMLYDDRIASNRVFGLQDMHESSDAILPQVPALYPFSLLYFVSGLLEGEPDVPILGMNRYYTNRAYDAIPNVKVARAFFNQSDLMWSPVNHGAGRTSAARSHLSFESDPDTLNSITHNLSPSRSSTP